MKNTRKNIPRSIFLILAFVFAVVFVGYAQKSNKKDQIKSMVAAKEFIFKAQVAIPQRGSTRYLTSEYDLRVSKDTITAFLPYFGRAYSAPMDPGKGGIKFTSTDFIYNSENTKRGWEITITPKDTRDSDVRYLVLSISNGGYGTLRIVCNNRDGISFSGNIVSLKER